MIARVDASVFRMRAGLRNDQGTTMNLRRLATTKWKRDPFPATTTIALAALFLLLVFGMGFAPAA